MTENSEVTVATGSKTTGETIIKVVDWDDCFPATIDDGPKFGGTDVAIANLFNFLDRGWNLYVFLDRFPSVRSEQALTEIDKRIRRDTAEVADSAEEYIGGTPRFVGTRVPVKYLFDHMAGGHSLDEFLDDFPSVSRERAVGALAAAAGSLELIAYEAAAR